MRLNRGGGRAEVEPELSLAMQSYKRALLQFIGPVYAAIYATGVITM